MWVSRAHVSNMLIYVQTFAYTEPRGLKQAAWHQNNLNMFYSKAYFITMAVLIHSDDTLSFVCTV